MVLEAEKGLSQEVYSIDSDKPNLLWFLEGGYCLPPPNRKRIRLCRETGTGKEGLHQVGLSQLPIFCSKGL